VVSNLDPEVHRNSGTVIVYCIFAFFFVPSNRGPWEITFSPSMQSRLVRLLTRSTQLSDWGRPTNVIPFRLSVEDSPNSAGVVIDAIRCCKLALDRKIGGPLLEPSSYFMKSPPKQLNDTQAFDNLEKFINS